MDAIASLRRTLEKRRPQMIEMQRDLTAVPALGPENGGSGEWDKAQVLVEWLRRVGLGPCESHPAPDPRVPKGERPNIIVTLPGGGARGVFWIMSHLDIVPPGDPALWESDPYTMSVKGDALIGRGVEDNQQGLVASVFAAACVRDLALKPARTTRLLFVSDEETGSQHGVGYLVDNTSLFGADDRALVPDSGSVDGSEVEIAEKSILWLRFATHGKQCHASVPQKGLNAFEAASHLVVRLGGLSGVFGERDALFDPSGSTFSPTKKDANVPNINTIPGEDAFHLDCRILPQVDLETVLKEVRGIANGIERDFGVTVDIRTIQRASSPPTPADAPIVSQLARALKAVYAVEARSVGIGGGTVGAFLRNKGMQTVVWSRIEETAHMPNERCLVANMMGDALVMALMMREQ